MYVQKCRKMCGLGRVNCARTKARVTQPSPHIILHIGMCSMLYVRVQALPSVPQDHLHEFILEQPEYREGNMEEAILKGFLQVGKQECNGWTQRFAGSIIWLDIFQNFVVIQHPAYFARC